MQKFNLQSLVVLSIVVGSMSGVSIAGPQGTAIPGADTHSKNKVSTTSAIQSKLKYREGEVIVKYKNTINVQQAKSLSQSNSLDVIEEFRTLTNVTGNPYQLVRSKKGESTEQLIERLEKNSDVEFAEPNYIYHPNTTPNDPDYNKLWGQNNTGQTGGIPDADLDVPEAWDRTTGGNDVVVVVIDTGVDYEHEDLKDNMWINSGEIPNNGIDDDSNGYVDDVHGINAIDNSGDPMDKLEEDGGHGTHVAGTIAAVGNNNKGVVGVSWNAKVMGCKFLGIGGGFSTDAIKCLEYVLAHKNNGVNIVATNNSWGGGGSSQTVKDAIAATNNAGIPFLAAAGNDGTDNDTTPHYPSSYDLPGVIAVASTDHNDDLSSFSNYGATSVDLAAPGSSIYSSSPRTAVNTIFYDDFESGMGGWTTGGTLNSWAITTDQEVFENPGFPVPSPTHFLSDSPGANYLDNTNSWVMSAQNIDLSSYVGIRTFLQMGVAAYIESGYDNAQVEVSGDGGSSWVELKDFSGYANYWSDYLFIIPDSLKTTQFRMRFTMISDYVVNHPGWLIDNVGIGTEQQMVSNYTYKSGTSMATPQVAGAVTLLSSVCLDNTDGNSVARVRDHLLNSVDVLPSLSGKVSTEGRLNVDTLLKTCPTNTNSHNLSAIYYLLLN